MKEVVIKVPDEMYDWFVNGFPDKVDLDELQRIVINGTPLPKGHGSLIDQDALIGKIHGVRSITAVLDAPTIIEADGGDTE